MSEYGLAIQLSEAFGRKVSPEEALTWLNKHKKAYPVFWAWKEKLQRQYKRDGFIRLADGWYMWGDNDNYRSVGNVPVQGMGSCVMRKAVQLAQQKGLDVIYTLHDAIYIECDTFDDEAIATLAICMDEAFRFYFPEELKSIATVRLDADTWSPTYSEKIEYYETHYVTPFNSYQIGIKQQQTYIDERGADEYNKYKQYFTKENYENYEF
jgi:hypothetical protein